MRPPKGRSERSVRGGQAAELIFDNAKDRIRAELLRTAIEHFLPALARPLDIALGGEDVALAVEHERNLARFGLGFVNELQASSSLPASK